MELDCVRNLCKKTTQENLYKNSIVFNFLMFMIISYIIYYSLYYKYFIKKCKKKN